jgi:hypothetical protein
MDAFTLNVNNIYYLVSPIEVESGMSYHVIMDDTAIPFVADSDGRLQAVQGEQVYGQELLGQIAAALDHYFSS